MKTKYVVGICIFCVCILIGSSFLILKKSSFPTKDSVIVKEDCGSYAVASDASLKFRAPKESDPMNKCFITSFESCFQSSVEVVEPGYDLEGGFLRRVFKIRKSGSECTILERSEMRATIDYGFAVSERSCKSIRAQEGVLGTSDCGESKEVFDYCTDTSLLNPFAQLLNKYKFSPLAGYPEKCITHHAHISNNSSICEQIINWEWAKKDCFEQAKQ